MISDRSEVVAERPSWRVGRWLWEWCSAKETLLVFLIVTALGLSISYAFPQMPAYVRSDPLGYQDWLSTSQVRFKTWTPVLEAVGFFWVFDTYWFRVLVASLALVSLVSAGNQFDLLLPSRRIRQPPVFYNSPEATHLASALPAVHVTKDVRHAMECLFGHVRQEAHDEREHLYSSRAVWLSLSVSAAYLGLLLVMVSLVINARWGWQQSNAQLFPDQSILVGPQASQRIRLVSQEAESVVLRLGDSRQVAIAKGEQARQHGYGLELVDADLPMVRLSARRADDDGEALTLYDYVVRPEPVESLQFGFSPGSPSDEIDYLFIVSDEKVVGRLKWLQPEKKEDEPPRFHLWVFHQDGQTLVGEQDIVADQDLTSVTIGDVRYVLEVTRFVILNIAYRPGRWTAAIGIGLLIVGLLGNALPRQQMWARVYGRQEETAIEIRDLVEGVPSSYLDRKGEMLEQLRDQIRQM